jgi:hypothetical protein
LAAVPRRSEAKKSEDESDVVNANDKRIRNDSPSDARSSRTKKAKTGHEAEQLATVVTVPKDYVGTIIRASLWHKPPTALPEGMQPSQSLTRSAMPSVEQKESRADYEANQPAVNLLGSCSDLSASTTRQVPQASSSTQTLLLIPKPSIAQLVTQLPPPAREETLKALQDIIDGAHRIKDIIRSASCSSQS